MGTNRSEPDEKHAVSPNSSPASHSDTPVLSSSSSYLPWLLAALALAGCSYLYIGTGKASGGTQITTPSLPESYGLCGKIYTVDQDKPTVDCILVRKDTIISTGTRGNLFRNFN